MKLKDHDLRQLNVERLQQLRLENPDALVRLSISLLEYLKAAREQLNQNPNNSSRPPSKGKESSEDDASSSESKKSKKSASQKQNTSRSPDKKKGAKGVGRTQKLSIDHRSTPPAGTDDVWAPGYLIADPCNRFFDGD